MHSPVPKMGSGMLLALGKFHLAALEQDEATKGLALGFKPTVEALASAKAAREQAEQGLIQPRVAARFAEFAVEIVLRDIAFMARNADNRAGGDLVFRAVFPNGLDAEVRPRGAAQLAASQALRTRLDAQPAAAPIKAQALKPLDDALAALGAALEARRKAELDLGIARAAEDGARETFCSGYDSNAGAIRQMFPRNRARQDLHFDQFRVSHGSDNGDSTDQPPPSPGAGDDNHPS